MPGGAVLLRHPGSDAGPVVGLDAAPGSGARGALLVRYRLAANLARLRVPAPAPLQRADGLWRHTCFEAFVRRAGEEAYHEFNFSPSGEWAAYTFRRYRERGSNLAGDFNPKITVHRDADRLELSAVIPRAFLPPGPPEVPLRLGLSAVIEDRNGVLSYWALRHPPGKPDFHHPDAFALELKEES
jgi:hypothetical protein